MILKDLLDEVEFDFVFDELVNLYYQKEDQEAIKELYNGYSSTFYKLQNMQPKFDGENFCIKVDKTFEWDIDENENIIYTEDFYYNVHGINTDTNQSYAIEFEPWGEWLGWDIDREQVKELSKEAYVAHILWEMTYIGFDENSIQETISGLKEMVDDIKEDFKNKDLNLDQLEKEDREIWEDSEDDDDES